MDPTQNTPTPEATGTTPAGTTPEALDFTGGANSLSMADSLASAQDNLTSAGMAAKDAGNAALGLDQISSGDPTATMDRPDEPLIPAAPVPGSIGSVTSGPAVADPVAAVAPVTEPAAAAPTAATEAPATTPYNPFAATTEAQAAPAAAAAPVPQASAPDMTQASSSNVPTALQPKTSKFSMKIGQKSSALTWILGIAAAIFAIAAVVFLVLWIMSKDNGKIVYVPNVPVRPDPVETSMICVMDRAAGEEDGMEGLNGIYSTVTLNYSDDVLTNYGVLARYNFDSAEQAEASRTLFATMVTLFAAVGAGNGETPLSASYDVADNTVSLDMQTNVTAALETDDITLDLPMDENGEYLLDPTSTTDYLTGQGYTCE